MHSRRSSTTLLLVAAILLAGLLVGCGGGGDQAGNGGSQGDGSDGEKQGEAPQGNAPQVKIALGTIISVKPDRSKIILRPSMEMQGGERMIFKVTKNAEITLNNEPAEMSDVKEGQQAQIQYVVVNELNRARSVALISNGEGDGG